MKITVDASTCVGCGLCEQNCPKVFKLEDDGIAHVLEFSDPACDLKETAEQCPVSCIKVE